MKMNHYRGRQGYRGRRSSGNEDGHMERLFFRHPRGGGPRGSGLKGGSEGNRRFFQRGEFKFALLELLASAPMHGYQLIKAMEEKTGGLYTPSAGSVYPNLQLLEDMNFIGSSEEDGKKLYHITDEGNDYLRQSGKADAERPEKLWERQGRRPLSEKNGKHELRKLMKERSEVIYLMASAAKAAQDNPASLQAEKFEEIMTNLLNELKQLAGSGAASASSTDSGQVVPPSADSSSSPGDQ